MTPFQDAVCLVHGEQADRLRFERIQKLDVSQSFRRNINKAIFILRKILQAQILLGGGQCAVDVGGGDIAAAEAVHLVFHQRNQRRDDESDAIELQRGELKDERLARARRHDRQGVLLVEERANRLLCPARKVEKPK